MNSDLTLGGAKGPKPLTGEMRHRIVLFFRTECKNQVVYLHCSPAGCETFYISVRTAGSWGNDTGGQDRTMAPHLIWNVRVICAGNVNKGQKQCITWRMEAEVQGRRGYIGVLFFIHSLADSLVHPFTRVVIAPLAAPPVPAYTCAMRPGHAFCYMLPV